MPRRSERHGGRPPGRTAAAVSPLAETPAAGAGGHTVTTAALEEEGFCVDVPGFTGQLDELVAAARRRDVDLAPVSVSAITGAFRERLSRVAEPDAQELADFLDQASRLVALKASRLIPGDGLDLEAEDATAGDTSPVDDPGARLADYRLFRAAVDQFLAGVTDEASRSFLATALSPETAPAEKLTISQERLVGALREALARLPRVPTASVHAPATAVSVDGRCVALRALLAERGTASLDEVFAAATSRLEAIATFLALLEMLKHGEVSVEPDEMGVLVVSARAGSDADAGPDGIAASGGPEIPAEPVSGAGGA